MKKQNKNLKSVKKLSLNKETLVQLTHQESVEINGGKRLTSEDFQGCTSETVVQTVKTGSTIVLYE